MIPEYLTRERAAEYLTMRGVRYAPRTLANLYSQGLGPPVHHIRRRTFYKPAELDAWLAERLQKDS